MKKLIAMLMLIGTFASAAQYLEITYTVKSDVDDSVVAGPQEMDYTAAQTTRLKAYVTARYGSATLANLKLYINQSLKFDLIEYEKTLIDIIKRDEGQVAKDAITFPED